MKRLLTAALCLILLLTLPACGFSLPDKEYTRPKETLPPETYGSDDVTGLAPGEYTRLGEETIEDFESGITTRTEYLFDKDGFPSGLTVWENGIEIRHEDWETDARGNLTKNTVTYLDGETEIWEYELTYNAYFDIAKKVCSLNGDWQYTYDYEYIANPYRLTFINVAQAGTDCPPWYVFGYKDNRLVNIIEIYPHAPEDYRIKGSIERSREEEYDESGNLTNRRVSLGMIDGFYQTYYEKFAYEGNAVTISRFKGGGTDLLMTAVETYDDAGSLISREEFSPDGQLLRRTSYSYRSVTVK